MAVLSMTFLGPPQVTGADGSNVLLRARKELALLAYLAVEQQHSHSRDTLLGLLWPEASEEAARNSLRVALANLRRLLGETNVPFLRATRHTVQFASDSDHTLDVAVFAGLLAACRTHAHNAQETCVACMARLAEAVALYQGDFLHGFSLPDSVPFEEWAIIQREQLQQQMLDALDTLIAAHERLGDYAALCRYARRQLELEGWRESAHAQLMRGLWASGQRGAALEQYDACCRILQAELGLEPSPELTALYEQIRTAELRIENGELRTSATRQFSIQPAQFSISPHNLPAQLTSFIGRAEEATAVREALPNTRLLTLTGAGGCGKTRLALEVARTVVAIYPDGVWLVELASLTDSALVPQAVAAALGLREAAGQSLNELLAHELRTKRLVLLLDNCEHLLAGCQRLAEQVLQSCPFLTILATSRSVLQVAGEYVWPVPPLATPDATGTALEQFLTYDSIRLFVERAQAANTTFALTERNMSAIAQICRRLDGIPLALELAAARVRHMAAETIATRLDDSFSLLSGGSQMALPRQQTLRATIDWSYALLPEPERTLLYRLAVFAGGWTLDAAEEIAGVADGASLGGTPVVDLLANLIDQSLLLAEMRNDAMRYRLLETTRDYAREKLVASGEAEAVRDRHTAYFLHLTEQAEPQLFGADQVAWLDRLAAEHANLRVAIDWAVEQGTISTALRLVTALRYFWRVRGYYNEGIDRLLRLLAHPAVAEHTVVRVRALNAAGYLQSVRGNGHEAHELLGAALAIGREINDLPNIAFALRYLSTLANAHHEYHLAITYGEESLAIYRALDATNDIAISLMYLGDIALGQRDDDRAQTLYAESVEILRRRHNSISLPYPLRHLGYLALLRGDIGQASVLCQESLVLNRKVGERQGVAACLVSLSAVAVANGEFTEAAQLLGHAESLVEALHTQLLPFDRAQHEHILTRVRAQLDPAALATAQAEGRAMTIEQLLAQLDDQAGRAGAVRSLGQIAITEGDAPRDSATAPQPDTSSSTHTLPTSLTPFVGRERELAAIAALLEQPDARLVTLYGLGGMGKTRLALELARLRGDGYTDGVCFVALAPLASAPALPSAIAQALDVSLHGDDPKAALLRVLRPKHMLLILDNCEHLLDGIGLAVEIAQAAPRVQLLATSRAPLKVRGEQLYHVEGLAFTPDAPLAEAATAPAVRLFVQSARRIQPDFTLDDTNLPAVLRICQQVHQMPLGLELAAAWVATLSVSEIADEIEHSVDFLVADWVDVPERQRSLRAVFAWSWQLLTPPEQQALARLSVMRGSFSRADAQVVAQTSLPVLAALVNKSLLRQAGTGRYAMHELLRQFAAEQLAAREADSATQNLHAQYYLGLIGQQERSLLGQQPLVAAHTLREALANIRQAWCWAVERSMWKLLDEHCWALALLYRIIGLLHEGALLFGLAAKQLEQDINQASQNATQQHVLAGHMLGLRARFLLQQTRYGEAISVAQTAIQYAHSVGDLLGEALGYFVWGSVLRSEANSTLPRDQYLAVRTTMERAITLCDAATARTTVEQLHLLSLKAEGMHTLTVTLAVHGELALARPMSEQALQICREIGNGFVEKRLLISYAEMLEHEGRFGQALGYREQEFRFARDSGATEQLGTAHNNLATTLLYLGDYANARTHAYEALRLHQELNIDVALTHNIVSWVVGQLGAYDEALRHAQLCLDTIHEYGDHVSLSDGLLAQGNALVGLGRWHEAEAVYGKALTLAQNAMIETVAATALARLAHVALVQGQHDLAFARADAALELLHVVRPSVILEPLRSDWSCYQALAARSDPRAEGILRDAYTTVMQQAEWIEDAARRRSFLQVAVHRDIVRAFAALSQGERDKHARYAPDQQHIELSR